MVDPADDSARIAPPESVSTRRLVSIDALRGLVMVIMALDHTRDFFHMGAMHDAPEDLASTTVAVFLTRWVTHICAPTFVLLAGLGAYLRVRADGHVGPTARFLWTRGLWLVALELTIMRLAMNFTFDARYPFLLITLWSLGASMIIMSGLIRLPHAGIAAVSLVILLLHNTLDAVRPEAFGPLAPLWTMLHVPGVIRIGGLLFVVGYPVLPFMAIMAAGCAIGPIVAGEAERRKGVLVTAGISFLVLFIVLRAINVYGDPSPWSPQPTLALTVLSVLRVTKYPPSLLFALMTLGGAALAWWQLERRSLSASNPLVVIGRVPLFYYVIHFWWLHVLAAVAAFVRYGTDSFRFLFSPLPSMGGSLGRFPADFGYSLAIAYVVWVFVVVSVYPVCRWYARVKSRRRDWWLSYL